MIYFESSITFISDLYKRYFIVLSPIIIDNEEEYKIKRLIRK